MLSANAAGLVAAKWNTSVKLIVCINPAVKPAFLNENLKPLPFNKGSWHSQLHVLLSLPEIERIDADS